MLQTSQKGVQRKNVMLISYSKAYHMLTLCEVARIQPSNIFKIGTFNLKLFSYLTVYDRGILILSWVQKIFQKNEELLLILMSMNPSSFSP